MSPFRAGDDVEKLASMPPSPASTVGIARRHSVISLLERPSTVRLVSPSAPESVHSAGALPFSGIVKQRRSMAPLSDLERFKLPMTRKSMPALSASMSGQVSPICPQIPPIPSPPLAVPGALPKTFGAVGNVNISNEDFSTAMAGIKVLKDINARLGGVDEDVAGDVLDRGGKRPGQNLSKSELGGWGTSSIASGRDRYAKAHEREFAK